MTTMEYLPHLGGAMARMAQFIGAAEGDETVPACPGWTVNDLAVHLGTVHRWAAGIVLIGQRLEKPHVLATEPLDEWYAGTATALLAALQAVEPTEPVPNFAHVFETAAFWPRRQMHETTVHAVDAAQALGLGEDSYGIDPDVADDGIDEVFSVFFPRMTDKGQRPDVFAPVRVTATDTGRSWVLSPAADPADTPILLPPTSVADAELSGTATDLYLGLWHRAAHDRLTADGDAAARMLAGPKTP